MIRAFAFYFPQFYQIAENDRWWGKGFTDWDLVKKARPLVKEQTQPRIPLNGYLDQSDPLVIVNQAQLLKRFGLSGFNFYHYWFDGQVLLDAPVKNLLVNKTIDIEYMLTWANESWTRQWVGKPNQYLIKQTYSSKPEKIALHYAYLRTFFLDSRYVKLDGSPVLCIYRPEIIPDLLSIQEQLTILAINDGFTGIYFLACRSYDFSNADATYLKFSGIINFNPRYAVNSSLRSNSKHRIFAEKLLRLLPERMQSTFASVKSIVKTHQIYDYNNYLKSMETQAKFPLSNLPVYSSIFPEWDNTARYGKNATFFTGATPELFAQAAQIAYSALTEKHQQWLFINAWNEWSEAAYLEPDKKNGTLYLEALQKVLTDAGP